MKFPRIDSNGDDDMKQKKIKSNYKTSLANTLCIRPFLSSLCLRPLSSQPSTMRSLPNILIAGTPGVGKTTTCTQLFSLAAQCTPPLTLRHLSINDVVKTRGCHTGYDAALQTLMVDEDKLMDEVEKDIEDGEGQGGWVIDWHSTAGFAVRWVDLVVVLRCEDTSVLYDRLTARGYPQEKVQENMDAEIFGVVAEEAREGWDEQEGEGSGKVVELRSVEAEHIDENAERVLQWIQNWVKDQRQHHT